MFVRFDIDRVRVYRTYKGFMSKPAVERVDNDEWLRIKHEEAAVERRIEELRSHEFVIRSNTVTQTVKLR